MRFNSINNFEVTINNDGYVNIAKKDVTSVISPVEESNSNRIRETKPIIGGVDDECTEMAETWYSANNFMWLGTILISFVIWITCIVSLVLNCTRKNVGKAVFSGIGLIVPFIAIIISSVGRTIYEIEESGMGTLLVILALVLQLVVEIMAFIFCFSKKKKENNK